MCSLWVVLYLSTVRDGGPGLQRTTPGQNAANSPRLAMYETAYRFAFSARRKDWNDARRWHIDGNIANLAAVSRRLQRRWPRVTYSAISERDEDDGYLIVDVVSITLNGNRQVEAFLRVHRRGAYDHVHRSRGYNLWEWVTLRLNRTRGGRWRVVGLKEPWGHS